MRLNFQLEDTGTGIDSAKMSSLFTRFGKLEDKLGLNSSGIGLGLTIAKEIIEKLNGKIEVESRIGYGTRFKFYVIVVMPEAQKGGTYERQKVLKAPLILSNQKLDRVLSEGRVLET